MCILNLVSRDNFNYLKYNKFSSKQKNIKKYIDQRLPEEYEKCLVGLTAL